MALELGLFFTMLSSVVYNLIYYYQDSIVIPFSYLWHSPNSSSYPCCSWHSNNRRAMWHVLGYIVFVPCSAFVIPQGVNVEFVVIQILLVAGCIFAMALVLSKLHDGRNNAIGAGKDKQCHFIVAIGITFGFQYLYNATFP